MAAKDAGHVERSGGAPPARFWIWAALLAGAALAFGIGIAREPLWLDETYTLGSVRRDVYGVVRRTAWDVHPPGYYLMLKAWTLLFGTSEAALRFPSALAAVALAALGAGPVRRLWGARAGYAFAALVVLSPGVLGFAQEARMYTLLAALVTACVLWGILAVIEGRTADFVRFAAFALGAALTHYYGAIAVGFAALALALLAATTQRTRLRPLGVALAVAVLVALPWLYVAVHQLRFYQGKLSWIPAPTASLAARALAQPFGYRFLEQAFPWQAFAATALALALVVYGAFALGRRGEPASRRALLVPIATLFGTLISTLGVSLWVPSLQPRYLMACAGLFLVAAAVGWAALPGPWLRALSAAALLALLLPIQATVRSASFNGPFRELASYVATAGGDADPMLHADIRTFGPASHVLARAHHVLLVPRRGTAVDHWSIPSGELDAVLAASRRLWLVDTPLALYRVSAADVLARPGWRRLGAARRFAPPSSWLTFEVSRFERADTRRPGYEAQIAR